jgi:hypothetical protein
MISIRDVKYDANWSGGSNDEDAKARPNAIMNHN